MQIVYGKNKTEDDYMITKQCRFCKKKFNTFNKKQIYCSNECRKKYTYHKNKKNETRKESLCWECKNACGGCSWSSSFVQVKNWKAKPTKVKCTGGYVDSFHVIKCPEFDRD